MCFRHFGSSLLPLITLVSLAAAGGCGHSDPASDQGSGGAATAGADTGGTDTADTDTGGAASGGAGAALGAGGTQSNDGSGGAAATGGDWGSGGSGSMDPEDPDPKCGDEEPNSLIGGFYIPGTTVTVGLCPDVPVRIDGDSWFMPIGQGESTFVRVEANGTTPLILGNVVVPVEPLLDLDASPLILLDPEANTAGSGVIYIAAVGNGADGGDCYALDNLNVTVDQAGTSVTIYEEPPNLAFAYVNGLAAGNVAVTVTQPGCDVALTYGTRFSEPHPLDGTRVEVDHITYVRAIVTDAK